MIKIGMLLPYEDMLLLAKRVIEETGIQVDYIKVVNTVDAVNEARNAFEAGGAYPDCARLSDKIDPAVYQAAGILHRLVSREYPNGQ